MISGAAAVTDCPEQIVVGRVMGLQGLSGALRVEIISDVPHRFDVGEFVYIRETAYRIASSHRLHNRQSIVCLEGVDTVAAARHLVRQDVTVPATSTPELPEGEYFHFQILGLRVVTDAGEELGQVVEILETGSNDVYLVSGEGEDILIPAIPDVIKKIDLADHTILVTLLEGLR